MATIQTPWADGRETAPRPQTAGAVHYASFVLDLGTAGLAEGDVVEMGLLQPGARIVDMILLPEGTYTETTCSVGLMTGTPGDKNEAGRDSGAQFFAASTALTGIQRMSLAAGHNLVPTDTIRAIGMKFSALVAAASGKKVTLKVLYVQ